MMTKKKLVTLIVVMLSFSVGSCSGLSSYKYTNIYSMTSPHDSTSKEYGDKKIVIKFWIDEKRLNFIMKNLTDEPIIIDWAKAEYIHVDSKRHSVSNHDSMFTNARFNPPKSIIEAGAKIVDSVVPAKNVQKLEEFTWYVNPLLNQFDKDAYLNKGKTMGVDLPVYANGAWETYSFRFRIINVAPSSRRL